MHFHPHLDVLVDGKPVTVPGDVGIDTTGGKISELHTHDTSGVIHTESKTPTPNRLGQLFTEWAVKLDSSCVGGYCKPEASVLVYVDGRLYDGDPNEIGLADHREIAIVIGTPPQKIPASFGF